MKTLGWKGIAVLQKTVWENKYIPHIPYQQQRRFLAYGGLEALYGGSAGGGKLIYIKTPLYTIDGVTDIEHVKVGDIVFDEHGKPCSVVAVSDIEYGHDCYEITFSDGSKLIAADTHLWPAVSIKESSSKVVNRSTRELFETQRVGGKANYYIPVCKPLRYPKRNLELDPYILGSWLGGSTSLNPEIIALIKKIGCFENKHIPEIYLRSSVKQRVDLLRGLMDTGGHATPTGAYEIQSIRRELADGVSKLLHSLGIKHIVHNRINKWRIKFYTNIKVSNIECKSSRHGFRLTVFRRYITEIKRVPSVPTRCIQVTSESGCYLVGDSLIPTHNSDCLLMAALQYVMVPNYSALLLRRTYSDLALPGALMDRAQQWLSSTDARWSESNKVWTFPSGAKVTFGYLETENDMYRYQSSEFQFIGFDEVTQFPEDRYAYLFSRLRRINEYPVPIRMRAATNPGGIGHDWVMRRFPIMSPEVEDGPIFVPAKLYDNPHIDQESYAKALEMIPDVVTREQLLNGRWDITASGEIFSKPPVLINFTDHPASNDYKVYGACDPSEGGNDYASIITIIELPDHRWLVYDCDLSIDNQSTTIDKIITLHSLYNYKKFWIESNSLGHAKSASGESLFEAELKKRQAIRKLTVPYDFIWNTTKKADRIRAMEPFYSNGQMVFMEDWQRRYPELMNQLKAFPHGTHDDAPDALSTVIMGILRFNRNEVTEPVPIPVLIGGSKWSASERRGWRSL